MTRPGIESERILYSVIVRIDRLGPTSYTTQVVNLPDTNESDARTRAKAIRKIARSLRAAGRSGEIIAAVTTAAVSPLGDLFGLCVDADRYSNRSKRSCSDGYVYVRVARNRDVPEHRYLAERQLRRPLAPGENIHHRNGDRTDNRVGPCLVAKHCDCSDGPHNLELWDRPQNQGQRAGDLVVYAVEVLQKYAPQLLAVRHRSHNPA